MRPLVLSLGLVGLIGPAMAVAPLVDLGYTRLQGVSQQSGVTQWLGVRYAAPPVGELRFSAPIDPPATEQVVDATQVKKRALLFLK